jgi:ornithine carbamoyltransferase
MGGGRGEILDCGRAPREGVVMNDLAKIFEGTSDRTRESVAHFLVAEMERLASAAQRCRGRDMRALTDELNEIADALMLMADAIMATMEGDDDQR